MRAMNGANAEHSDLAARGVDATTSKVADNFELATVCRRRSVPRTLLTRALGCATLACLVGGPTWGQYPSPPPPQPIFHPHAAPAANAPALGNPLSRSSPAHSGHLHNGHLHNGHLHNGHLHDLHAQGGHLQCGPVSNGHIHGGYHHSGPTLGPPFLGDSFLAGSRVGVSRLADPCAATSGAMTVPCEPEALTLPVRCGCFSAGFEMLWMRAHFDQNVAMIIDPVPGNRMVDFQYEHEFTPRVWVGWNSARGAGVRVTYWGFDERAETETATAVAGATPVYLFVYGAGGNLTRNAYADLAETLTSRHQLELHATDLELTHRMQWDSLELLGGAGVRIARMDQRLRGEVYDAGGGLLEVVTNDLLFEGAGPTASLQLVRGIGHSGLSFYGRLRGALLMGETRQSIFEMKDAGANEVLDRANQDEVLSVAEMALGLQWDRPLGPRVLGYVRSAYECQVWMDAGGPVDSDSTISLDGITLAAGVRF